MATAIEKISDKIKPAGIKKAQEAYKAPTQELMHILGIFGVFLIKKDVTESKI